MRKAHECECKGLVRYLKQNLGCGGGRMGCTGVKAQNFNILTSHSGMWSVPCAFILIYNYEYMSLTWRSAQAGQNYRIIWVLNICTWTTALFTAPTIQYVTKCKQEWLRYRCSTFVIYLGHSYTSTQCEWTKIKNFIFKGVHHHTDDWVLPLWFVRCGYDVWSGKNNYLTETVPIWSVIVLEINTKWYTLEWVVFCCCFFGSSQPYQVTWLQLRMFRGRLEPTVNPELHCWLKFSAEVR